VVAVVGSISKMYVTGRAGRGGGAGGAGMDVCMILAPVQETGRAGITKCHMSSCR